MLSWHLPFIRAIAATTPGRRVTFLAPPSSGARELLVAEPTVAEVCYFEYSGSELQRGINLIRLVGLLKHGGFTQLWILDRAVAECPSRKRVAASGSGRHAAKVAGIEARQ